MTSPAHLLVVDDNPIEAQIIEEAIRGAFPEVRVTWLDQPDEVLAACEREDFDCALIDFSMPRLDGLSMGREISVGSKHLPMVLMTAFGDEALAATSIRSGFSDYIPKGRIEPDSIRRTIERAIASAQQARVIAEQREELEQFAHALAHDFKQPLRQIRSFVQLLASELQIQEGSEEALHMKYLTDAATRLGALVDVMSQYTLLNDEPELEDVELSEIMPGLREDLGAILEERGGTLIVQSLPAVRGNGALVTRALQNLVVNGLRYNESDAPTITVSADDAEAGKVRLCVADNGIGIDADRVEEIFKPLVRLHAQSTYPGTGLGLTIARKAIAAQGGSVWCQSTPGVGSRFYIEMDAAFAHEEAALLSRTA